MFVDPKTPTRSGDDRKVDIECECGANLTSIPAGFRLCRPGDRPASGEKRSVTCARCTKTTVLRVVADDD